MKQILLYRKFANRQIIEKDSSRVIIICSIINLVFCFLQYIGTIDIGPSYEFNQSRFGLVFTMMFLLFSTGVAKLQSSMQNSQNFYFKRDKYLNFYSPEVFLLGNQISFMSQQIINNLIFCAFYFTYFRMGVLKFFQLWFMQVILANSMGRSLFSIINIFHRNKGNPVVVLAGVQFILVGSSGIFNYFSYRNIPIKIIAYLNPMQYLFSGSLLILFGDDPQVGLCNQSSEGSCNYFNLKDIPVKSLWWIFIILVFELTFLFWVQALILRIIQHMEQRHQQKCFIST